MSKRVRRKIQKAVKLHQARVGIADQFGVHQRVVESGLPRDLVMPYRIR